MAKITPGPVVGQISGSVGSTVFSHNRYGAYTRLRTIPTNPGTEYQIEIRAILGACSSAWKALTEEQKAGWNAWAQTNPIIDRLGAQQVLAGNVAYISLNHRILQAAETPIDDPPVSDAPQPLLTLVLSADIGVGTFDVAFTATPLAATQMLWVMGCVTDSDSITYVRNRLKLLTISAAALASPLDIQSACALRFGTLAVGQLVTVQVAVFDNATGLLSVPLRDSAVIVST